MRWRWRFRIAMREPDEAEADMRRRVAEREVIIGFGHPVYTISDPRSDIIKAVAHGLAKASGDLRLYSVAERIETTMQGCQAHVPESRLVQRGCVAI